MDLGPRITGLAPWVLGPLLLVDSEPFQAVLERHLYSRTNFKLNRAAALAEWRQLLSA